MKATKRHILLLILTILATSANASVGTHRFYDRFDTHDGLPDSYITSCTQDEFGRIWVATHNGVFYYTGSRFISIQNDEFIEGCTSHVSTICADSNHRIWICSSNGTGYYNTFTGGFTLIRELEGHAINDVDIDSKGNVWLTSVSGIWKFDSETETINKEVNAETFKTYRTCIDENDRLVFTAQNGYIYTYNPSTRTTSAFTDSKANAIYGHIEYIGDSSVLVENGLRTVGIFNLEENRYETILDQHTLENRVEVYDLMLHEGMYWVGTSYGLVIYDPSTKEIERQFPDNKDAFNLGAESVRCLFSDKDNNVWAGTWSGGLRAMVAFDNIIGRFYETEQKNSLIGETIRSYCEDKDGYIWVGSEEGYLCRYNPKDRTFKDFTSSSSIPYAAAVTNMKFIDGAIWMAVYGGGIVVFDPVSCKAVKQYDLGGNYTMFILESDGGDIYAASRSGLFKLNREHDTFDRIEATGDTFFHCISEDNKGRLILASYGKGLGIYNPLNGAYKRMDYVTDNATIVNSMATSVIVDSKGYVWMTTDGNGTVKLKLGNNDEIEELIQFDMNSGMPSNSAGGVIEDNDGRIWISTTNGVVEMNGEGTDVKKIYMQMDEVIGSHFTFGSSFKSSNGDIYLGAAKGMLTFNPAYMRETFKDSKLFITSISSISMDTRRAINPAGRSVMTSDQIKVKQKDIPLLRISFSSMDYGSLNQIQYECHLFKPGFENKITTTNNYTSYTSLTPGNYTFIVSIAGCEDPSLSAVIGISVKAPWYRSAAAFLLYAIALLCLISYSVLYVTQKKKEEGERHLELLEAQKEKKLAQEKIDFLTNITHEIRTPVTVISMLMEKSLRDVRLPKEINEDLKSVKLNSERLQKLCTDLLDFRKVENGERNLVMADEDICEIGRKACLSFEPAAKTKGISFSSSIPDHPIRMNCDKDSIDGIMCNMISNAVKYCGGTIIVSISESDGRIHFRVNSDGTRIPEEESEMIFNAFYQSKAIESAGTGLGLTYSRQIAKMHKGDLFLDTSVKEFNSFVLDLPMSHEAVEKTVEASAEERAEDEAIAAEELTTGPNTRPVILVAEDNDAMRGIIRDELAKTYEIVTASNGEEALGIIQSRSVDLVVSDIMMPKMDGCELCNAIKSDIKYSHIPVLLLTAAVGVDSHIRSLKVGADSYIEKPFKMEILLANISNLFKNRDIRNEQFANSPLTHFNGSSFNKIEQDFMNKLHTAVQNHLSEVELTLTSLAEEMAVSKTTLSRKVKGNTGLTVNEYIRICRLKKAAELLAENKYRINEVAYLVGYSSPSYFTQSFLKQFGVLPSDFIKKNTD